MGRSAPPREVLRAFAQALRMARLKAGLTQEEAAHMMGAERHYWSNLENARRNITLMTAERAARAVGTTLRKLLAGTWQGSRQKR